MAKKKKPKKDEGAPQPLPKFGGFHPLASGLGDLKAKLEAERKATEEAAAKKGAPAPPPPPPRRPEPKPAPRDAKEDELTFHRMMAGVTPLQGKSSRVAVAGEARVAPSRPRPSEIAEKARAEAKEVLDHLHHLVDDAVRFEVTDDGRRVEGRRLDAAPALLRELRRGSLPIDARLDLHGLTADAARERVLDFLRDKRARGERCVLVIHGKGDRTPGGGVLRGEISAWLSQGRAREHVAAFATAREDDGGEGAVYVALRR